MAPTTKDLLGIAAKPVELAGRIANRPAGFADRYRPLYGLSFVERALRGERTLERAVRDKVVLVTGASSGIGEAAARQIGPAGGTVLLVARSADKLEALREQIAEQGGTAHVHSCDLTDLEAIDRLAEEVLDTYGRVDILVNNAGRSIRRSIALSYERFHDFERTMQLNYFAAVRLILCFLPGMRERRSGQVVNISSVGVQTRVPRFGAYIASKAALDTLCDSIQAEVQDEGVRFTTIYMPLVRTPMIAPTTMYERFPALTPDEAGELIAKAITHRSRRVSPPFGQAAAFADAVNPQLMDAVRNQGFKLFPESRAARGSKERTADQPPGTVGQAFARATRGVHW